MNPKRGDIVFIDFCPVVGHEQGLARPAVVLSHDLFNEKSGLIFVAPITSRAKRTGFEIEIDTGTTKGTVLCHQTRTMDFIARKGKVVDRVSVETVIKVMAIVKMIIN